MWTSAEGGGSAYVDKGVKNRIFCGRHKWMASKDTVTPCVSAYSCQHRVYEIQQINSERGHSTWNSFKATCRYLRDIETLQTDKKISATKNTKWIFVKIKDTMR